MATAAVSTAMSHERDKEAVHPFFLKAKQFATLPVDDECRRRPHQVEDAGTTAEHAMLADDEKPARKNGGKCVKRRSGSAGPKQATLEVFATKPETKPFTEDTMPTDSTNGHDAATVHADELEDDLSYRRRKRQRTASAEVEPGLEGTAKHPAPMAGARDDTGTSATLSWDEQLRMEAEGCAEAESDAVSSWEKEEKFVPAMSTEQPVARTHDPVAQLLEDALEQSERDCTPKSVFAGTKWTSGQPEQSNGEPSKPSTPPPLPKPTKMLQLKAGKLASPKAKKPQTEVESTTKQRLKRGQKQQKKQVVTVIKYPSISIDRVTMGTKIDGILDGLERFQQPMVALTPKMLLKKVTPKKALPKKPTLPTHPLFLGKAALKAAFQPDVAKKSPDPIVVPKLPSPRKIAGTPGKIRAQAQAHRATMNPPASFGHTFGSFQPRVTKYPGMRDAPWPWKSVAHVRGEISGVAHTEQPDIPETQRKLKHAAIIMNEAEDLIMRCSFDLRSSQSTGSLQIPERVVTSGPDIQRQVATELHTRFKQVANSSDSDGPSVQRGSSRSAPHPALLPIYSSIETNLTPFDKFECESQAWTQKYAPKTAVEVLQSQKESFILRDWLRSSTITAVDTGAHRSTTGSVKPGKPEKPEKKKKRKRAADLDDFIISSDDELAGTGDLEELEDDSAYERSPQKRSLVRGGAETSNHPSKSGNAVVLSGPNGCGKTAAVYAIAKELGFEVFELNSGSRRSGKDVLDKIGDMTENHLVQQVSKALSEDKPEDGKSVAIVDSDAPDPKQGSMISFFKPAAGREKTMPKSSAKSQKDDKAPQPRQQQRQSLILLEEVDVLFEEDKQFWMTVLTLAGHSKRPIVMTCNDESRLPLNALSLHALLRFTPPPIDLAVDYLLLIAAHEGHLLKRSAVKSLYQSRGHDLRGSIMDLDHWCQIGVGDSTGGFAWMLERYPPGIDIDSEGHTLRVASKETCFPGSGLIPYDLVCSSSYTTFDKDEELLLEACERWNLNAEDLLLPQSSLAESDDKLNTDATLTAPTSLLEYGRQSEINSAYDVSCGLGLRSGYEQPVDCTLPELSEEQLTNYITDCNHIYADAPLDYSNFNKRLAITMLLQAHRLNSNSTSPEQQDSPSHELSERSLISAILNHQSPNHGKPTITRATFSSAFDVLAEPPLFTLGTSQTYTLTASSFDREFSVLVTDLAPYVRTIAAYDLCLEAERLRSSSLLSAGGNGMKKLRMTRVARSAALGGKRENTRRERWFDKDVNLVRVMETGGRTWTGTGEGQQGESASGSVDEERSLRGESVNSEQS